MKSLLFSLIFLALLPILHADDVLFIGNSFVFTNKLPQMFDALATSKSKSTTSDSITKGGQGWAWHLFKNTEKTDALLKSKQWNDVVIQDYSTNATHANLKNDFFTNGGLLYDKIAAESPAATIVLYETWSYPAAVNGSDTEEKTTPPDPAAAIKAPVKAATPKAFHTETEMFDEIHKNYALLFDQLKARNPKRTVLMAPVGTAFASCRRAHPEIELFGKDHKHPSVAGTYLIACVFYATIFHDNPIGAALPAGKVTLDAASAKALQEVAAYVAYRPYALGVKDQP